MDNLQAIIEPAVKKKGVSVRQMCKDIDITEQGYYRAMRANSMRMSTYNKITEYLGIETNTNQKVSIPTIEAIQEKTEVAPSNNNDVSYWKSKYEESQEKIVHLLNTIQVLSLGKFRPVPFNPAYVLRR